VEGKLEKRTKGVFAPAGGRKLIAFIDDLNMPQKSKFGFIPPLELLKLWVDNGFWWVHWLLLKVSVHCSVSCSTRTPQVSELAVACHMWCLLQ
jgi:hypothetical protein